MANILAPPVRRRVSNVSPAIDLYVSGCIRRRTRPLDGRRVLHLRQIMLVMMSPPRVLSICWDRILYHLWRTLRRPTQAAGPRQTGLHPQAQIRSRHHTLKILHFPVHDRLAAENGMLTQGLRSETACRMVKEDVRPCLTMARTVLGHPQACAAILAIRIEQRLSQPTRRQVCSHSGASRKCPIPLQRLVRWVCKRHASSIVSYKSWPQQ
jgi:hypothetical protein